MNKNAVIYARYSSYSQGEQSIEGQLKDIYAFAERNNYDIICAPYIDRARTATNDKRPSFQALIRDSAKHAFDTVIVWKLDRFARSRADSAAYRTALSKNGVKVVSVNEPISKGASGIFYEAIVEAANENYSVELSEKVRRGIALSVEKFKFIGGVVPLGYRINETKDYEIDPATAPIVQKCFELYAAGHTLKEINQKITDEYGKSYFGANHNNSINRILENKNYIGVYTRHSSNSEQGDVDGKLPVIVDKPLFDCVQLMRKKDKKTPARARAYEEYLLTTRLFCGHCREMMVGVSGTGKSGAVFHYYTCKSVWKKVMSNGNRVCNKKNIKKSYIEDFIVDKAREQFTDENIDLIAATVSEMSRRDSNAPKVSEIKQRLKENKKAMDNLLQAIENGTNISILSERITEREKERSELEKTLAIEKLKKAELDETEIKFFLTHLKKGNIDDIMYRRALITIFINSVYLYDGDDDGNKKLRIIFNASGRAIEVDYDLLEEIENLENGVISSGERCSYIKESSPPTSPRRSACTARLLRDEIAHTV